MQPHHESRSNLITSAASSNKLFHSLAEPGCHPVALLSLVIEKSSSRLQSLFVWFGLKLQHLIVIAMAAPPRRAAALVAEELTRAELEATGDVADAESDVEEYIDVPEEDEAIVHSKSSTRKELSQRAVKLAEENYAALNNPADLKPRSFILSRLNNASKKNKKPKLGIIDPMLKNLLDSEAKSNNRSVEDDARLAVQQALLSTGTTTVEQQVKFGGQMVNISRQLQTKQALLEQETQSKQSGLDRMVANIVGRKGISTVEKSSADWTTYKHEKSLEEELADAPRKGFVEKADFLSRVDGRQFEIERAQRERERVRREAMQGQRRDG